MRVRTGGPMMRMWFLVCLITAVLAGAVGRSPGKGSGGGGGPGPGGRLTGHDQLCGPGIGRSRGDGGPGRGAPAGHAGRAGLGHAGDHPVHPQLTRPGGGLCGSPGGPGRLGRGDDHPLLPPGRHGPRHQHRRGPSGGRRRARTSRATWPRRWSTTWWPMPAAWPNSGAATRTGPRERSATRSPYPPWRPPPRG